MVNYPRILVVSNNSFSKTSNNGRTIANLFLGWPKDKIAQFCISTSDPDYSVCNNYYLLTDRSVLDGFKHLRKGRRCDIVNNTDNQQRKTQTGDKVYKTPFKVLLRHFVWGWKRWKSDELHNWINDFCPEMAFVMNSDATFILDIARYISKTKNIPLVMFNTEGFYFFNKNFYTTDKYFSNTFFRIYQEIYRNHFRKMMNYVSLSIHLNSLLKEDYEKEFGGKHIVLYTGSSLCPDEKAEFNVDSPKFSYLGNFGFDRPSALIEIAEVLQSINNKFVLDVYGKIPNQEIKKEFDTCSGINYCGMVPYDKVKEVIYQSTILFHAEVQSDRYRESLRYGFSTKIADSIASGHPFLMYSSPEIAGAKYVIETAAAWFAHDKQELKEKILVILTNPSERKRILGNAHQAALNNHNAKKNALTLKNEICKIVDSHNE